MAHMPKHLLSLPQSVPIVLVSRDRSARTKRSRRAEQADRRARGHVLARLVRVSAGRPVLPIALDPTRAQRPAKARRLAEHQAPTGLAVMADVHPMEHKMLARVGADHRYGARR